MVGAIQTGTRSPSTILASGAPVESAAASCGASLFAAATSASVGAKASDTARTLAAQTMLNLVRLTRLGFQAAASGFERLEENIARRQQSRTAPVGEAPPVERTAGEAAGEDLPRPDRPGPRDPGQISH